MLSWNNLSAEASIKPDSTQASSAVASSTRARILSREPLRNSLALFHLATAPLPLALRRCNGYTAFACSHCLDRTSHQATLPSRDLSDQFTRLVPHCCHRGFSPSCLERVLNTECDPNVGVFEADLSGSLSENSPYLTSVNVLDSTLYERFVKFVGFSQEERAPENSVTFRRIPDLREGKCGVPWNGLQVDSHTEDCGASHRCKSLRNLVGPARFELATSCTPSNKYQSLTERRH